MRDPWFSEVGAHLACEADLRDVPVTAAAGREHNQQRATSASGVWISTQTKTGGAYNADPLAVLHAQPVARGDRETRDERRLGYECLNSDGSCAWTGSPATTTGPQLVGGLTRPTSLSGASTITD